MIELLKSKRVWGGAAVLAVLSFLVAFGLNVGLGGFLQLPEGAELPDEAVFASSDEGPSSTRRTSSGPRSASTYKKPVMARNIFDSDALNVQSAGDEEVGGKTDLRVTLIATMVAVPERYSSALIADDGRESTALAYNIGQSILGEAEIIGIEQKRVILRRSTGEIEYLAIDDEGPPAAPKRGGTKVEEDEDDEDDGISKDGEVIVVERAVVDEALANVDQLASKLRVVPHKSAEGEIDGYRLSAIRRGSLFDKLGIKNGDVVHGVNGMPLTSADGAFSAFQSLQSESGFTFDVTRRGQRTEHKYEIR